MVQVCADRFGCAAARNKGTCGNRLTIKVDRLEQTILDGLQHHLMDPALLDVFAAEYVRHMNALKAERSSRSARDRAELARVTRELDRLVQAIMDGFSVAQAKDKARALERRKEELAARLQDAADDPVMIHPNMSQRYRQQIAALRQALNEGRTEAIRHPSRTCRADRRDAQRQNPRHRPSRRFGGGVEPVCGFTELENVGCGGTPSPRPTFAQCADRITGTVMIP